MSGRILGGGAVVGRKVGRCLFVSDHESEVCQSEQKWEGKGKRFPHLQHFPGGKPDVGRGEVAGVGDHDPPVPTDE